MESTMGLFRVPDKVHRLWNEWNLRGAVLFSLFLQVLLIFSAPLRKRTKNGWITSVIWLAYLLADWFAVFGIGLISSNAGQGGGLGHYENLEVNKDLAVFWAPFLLLHLGGPDTITAFSLEDNELWLRHLLGFVFQLVAVAYVISQSVPNELWIPAVLMFFAGAIKYAERTRALFLACLGNFNNNYSVPKIVSREEHLSDLDVVRYGKMFFKGFRGVIIDRVSGSIDSAHSSVFLLEGRTWKDAFGIMEVELNFMYDVMFTKMAVVQRKTGYIFRFVCCVLIAVSFQQFVAFHHKVLIHRGGRRLRGIAVIDTNVTLTLLIVAVSLELVSLLMLMYSDWTLVLPMYSDWTLVLPDNENATTQQNATTTTQQKATTQQKRLIRIFSFMHERLIRIISFMQKRLIRIISFMHERLIPIIFFMHKRLVPISLINKRWCQYVSQLNFTSYSVAHRSSLLEKATDIFGLGDWFDEKQYTTTVPAKGNLKEFIFSELKNKAVRVAEEGHETWKEIISAKGNWTLSQEYKSRLDDDDHYHSIAMTVSEQVEYDESILVWHIATEQCYSKDDNNDDPNRKYREICKILSDYMLYLLVMQPTLLGNVPQLRFRETCEHAKNLAACLLDARDSRSMIFRMFKEIIEDEDKEFREKILKKTRPGGNNSVLPKALKLAAHLLLLDKKMRWEMIGKVWVELMCFGAGHCIGRTHAQQLSNGGELITFVWLLMAHFGLGEQFQTAFFQPGPSYDGYI